MIERAEIRNWQSLRRVDLDFGRLTVIVGASSSGKSAFMRAMRAVASNVRGSGAITRGQKSCAISVRTGDATVTLERGDGTGSYRMLTGDSLTETFTKLAGGVPQRITEALRIAPVPTGGSSLNFAGQFDKPYLLDESGANVARELGELTNVNIIFEAVRTANKKRAMFASALKTRQQDLTALTTRVTQFADLPAKLSAVAAAEAIADKLQADTERVNRLRRSIEQLRIAEQVLQRSAVPQVPDIAPLLGAKATRDRLQALLTELTNVLARSKYHDMAIGHWSGIETDLDTRLTDVLRAAGECPLCGQRVH